MTFLPVAARELRTACRKPLTYWIRSASALLVIIVGTWFFLMMLREPPRQVSFYLFSIISGGAMMYALLSGVRSTSDCISQEKREGTLGLLFLTDLKGYDVVIGKLAANSINAFYSVLSVVPIMAIPLLMGGVTALEFARMAVAVVNALFFSLAIGMAVSAFCRMARHASGLTFLLIILFAGGGPAFGALLLHKRFVPDIASAFFLVSPGYNFTFAFDANFGTSPKAFWASLAVIHVLAWIFLFLASWKVPRSWQDRPATPLRLEWRQAWRHWAHGTPEQRHAFRKRLLDQNAFFWLTSRLRIQPALVWGVLGLMACGWLYGFYKLKREWLDPGVFVTFGIVMNLLIKGWFGTECGRQLAEDRHSGALELILSTPMTIQEIVHGQWLTLRRRFLGPILLVLSCWFLFMIVGARETIYGGDDRAAWVAFWLALMVMLVVDLLALFWVGLGQALVTRHPSYAGSATVFRILVVPWICFALMMVLVATGMRGSSWGFFLGLWFVIGLVVSMMFGVTAYNRVIFDFRTLAEKRFAAQPGFWKRLLEG